MIWILSGEVHNLPQSAQVEIKEGDEINNETILATTYITSDYGGIVRLDKKLDFEELNEIAIVTSSVLIKHALVIDECENDETNNNFFLNFSNGNKFLMLCSPGNKVNNGQVIGELVDTKYRTKTGGL